MISKLFMDAGVSRAPDGRLWELLMRYMPAAIALSLLVAVTGSAGLAGVAAPTDPRARTLIDTGRSLLA